jgi:porin
MLRLTKQTIIAYRERRFDRLFRMNRLPHWPGLRSCIVATAMTAALLPALAPTPASAGSLSQQQVQTDAPTGPLFGVAQNLADMGIHINSLAYDALENNVSTGNRVGRTSNNVTIFLGTDIDLGKLVGIEGGTLHVGVGLFFGRVRNGSQINAIQDTSSALAGLPILNRNRSWYLTSLSYEQKLFNDRLDVEVGRINAKRAFDLPYSGNAYSDDDPVFVMDGGTSPAPYAHWGGRASYRLTPRWQVGFGAYEVFPAEIRTFGTDFRIDQATGVLFVTNAVYQTHIADTNLPGRYEIVPFHNTSPVSDPLAPTSTHEGPYGIATRFQQAVWRPQGTGQFQHVDILGSFSYTPNPYVLAASNEELGLGLFGLTPETPNDSVAFKVDHLRLTSRAIDFEREARVSAGGPNIATSQDEFRFDVNAHIDLSHGLAFEPTVEYILNPDSDGLPNSPKVPQSGFAVAGVLVFKPNVLLGLDPG